MNLIIALITAVLSTLLVAASVTLGIDALLVVFWNHEPFTNGNTAPWQLGITAIALANLGGGVAGFGNQLISTHEPKE